MKEGLKGPKIKKLKLSVVKGGKEETGGKERSGVSGATGALKEVGAVGEESHKRFEGIDIPEGHEKAEGGTDSPEGADTREAITEVSTVPGKHRSPLYNYQGTFEIPEADKQELAVKIEEICVGEYEKMGVFAKKAASFLKGHRVASEEDYQCGTASFSTRTSLIEVNGNKYFVVYNYPGSDSHRKADRNCKKAWGDKPFKATEEAWRDTFTSRSLIPSQKADNPRIVILPFIQNISLVDLMEKPDPNKFKGDYEYGKEYDSLAKRYSLVRGVAASMSELHSKGVTWGEVIAANIGLSRDGKILFFDPETPYKEDTPEIEQKARDLLSWCTSACTSLSRSNKTEGHPTDYRVIVSAILHSYGDQEVIEFLKENLCKELKVGKTLRHPIAFGQFKARLAIDSRKQYNEILQAIREQE